MSQTTTQGFTRPTEVIVERNESLLKTAANQEGTTPNPRGQAQTSLSHHIDRLMDYGYPLRHIRTLEASEGCEWPDPQRVDKAHNALDMRGTCVVLVGPRGTGKTQLALELGLVLYEEHMVDQSYTTLSGLLQQEKDSWNKPPQLDGFNRPTSPLKKAKEVGLLVLDEIQEVAGTDWEMSQFACLTRGTGP